MLSDLLNVTLWLSQIQQSGRVQYYYLHEPPSGGGAGRKAGDAPQVCSSFLWVWILPICTSNKAQEPLLPILPPPCPDRDSKSFAKPEPLVITRGPALQAPTFWLLLKEEKGLQPKKGP